jgi:cysteine desulfurase family protein (TIGR01976 family)
MKLNPELVQACRQQFPALAREENGQAAIFFDGPAGTQVPLCVIDAISDYLVRCNANHGGQFATSRESDEWLHEAHRALADFVGGSDPDEIAFGQNMTSLTFAFSRALAKTWESGDRIIVTALDHDANISPWVLAAQDAGVEVKWVPFLETDYTLNLDLFADSLNERTRLVAVGAASNATGGINPIKQISQLAHQHGAQVFVDAVHFGPHGLIDVADWNCDFLACSTYKFFGPHLGLIWGRRKLMEDLSAYKVRPADPQIPGKWMTGTQSHESIAGGMACVDYLAKLGRTISGDADSDRRSALISAFEAITEYEQDLSTRLIQGLSQIAGIKIFGITDLDRLNERFPTVSITHEAISSQQLAEELGRQGIYVWSGNYYALEFTTRLGLEPDGMVRIGLVHYNTPEEIDRLLAAIEQAISSVAN